MVGVSVNRKRNKPEKNLELSTPYGSNIVVTASRAATLLKRPPIRLGDGKLRAYKEGADQDTLVTEDATAAKPPRRGARENTNEGDA